jgi:hypothetical protein
MCIKNPRKQATRRALQEIRPTLCYDFDLLGGFSPPSLLKKNTFESAFKAQVTGVVSYRDLRP